VKKGFHLARPSLLAMLPSENGWRLRLAKKVAVQQRLGAELGAEVARISSTGARSNFFAGVPK
jgi:DhnA family fructose-bisphosphate aldolase class Ia